MPALRRTRSTTHQEELEGLLRAATIEESSSSPLVVPELSENSESPPFPDALANDDHDMNANAYTPWGMAQRILSKQRFVEYDAMLEFVASHRFIQFNVKANRDRIRTAFAALRTAAPFAQTIRFPANTPYVHLENTSIDCWLTQLLQALDLPDRAMERSASGTDSSVSDAKRSANVAFNELHRVLCNLEHLAANGIYDMVSFEEHFNLVWA